MPKIIPAPMRRGQAENTIFNLGDKSFVFDFCLLFLILQIMGQIFLDFRLVHVLCGRVSTWIRDHNVDDGSFYGRRSLDIVVPELRQPTFTGRTLRLLVNGPRSAAEITEAIGMERGGRVSDALEQLVESGLVSADEGNNPATGAAAREKRYRIRDNYARFYLKYVEPAKTVIDGGRFAFGGFDALDGWESVMGLAFESLVLNHCMQLLKPRHRGAAQLVSAAPWRRAGSRKAPRTALVYEGTLAPIVEADGYFDAIVPFRRLLGL